MSKTIQYFQEGFRLFKPNILKSMGFGLCGLFCSIVFLPLPIVGEIFSFVISIAYSLGHFLIANHVSNKEPIEFHSFANGVSYTWDALKSIFYGLFLFIGNIGIPLIVFSIIGGNSTNILLFLEDFRTIVPYLILVSFFLSCALSYNRYCFTLLFKMFDHNNHSPSRSARDLIYKNFRIIMGFSIILTLAIILCYAILILLFYPFIGDYFMGIVFSSHRIFSSFNATIALFYICLVALKLLLEPFICCCYYAIFRDLTSVKE